MSQKTDEEKGRAFDELHDPKRTIFHIGHARRSNQSEDYDSAKIREASSRLLSKSMMAAKRVVSLFEQNSRKKP